MAKRNSTARFDSEGKLIWNGAPIPERPPDAEEFDDGPYEPRGAVWSCWCFLKIEDRCASATVRRHVWLPFAPSKGLALIFSDVASDIFRVERIEFVLEGAGCFWLFDKADYDICPCRPEEDCCKPGDMIRHHITLGWELDGEIEKKPWPRRRRKSRKAVR